jgi:predicted nucleic acid-binding protein
LLHAGYSKTVEFKNRLDFLIARNALTVVWISEAIATQTWQIFEQFNTDKQWSFTDCTSYVVMKDQGITEAFTFDHHFLQMGFIRRPD